MINDSFYPILFKPILKKIIWGGSTICSFKGITPEQEGIGESWELSCVEDNYSIVNNGELEGQRLDELIRKYGKRLMGEKVMAQFGTTFPLLIKLIDARDNLSIQVHPNDELAKKRHNTFGKTEMWYVINAAEGAGLYSGFSKEIDDAEYVKRVADHSLTEVLQWYDVKQGDVFFLPAGRIHAIGSGCFIAEIQQTSDITYRIYDYNRKDANGENRELHTELSREAIDYTLSKDYRTLYSPAKDSPVSLVNCRYFTTNLLDLEAPMARDFKKLDSFVIYICLEGSLILGDNHGNTLPLRQGQTALISADTTEVTLEPSPRTKLLETCIL
jgi:mannose-6-phosphate isomerase